MTVALKLVQFLEDRGDIFHLGELGTNLIYLERFIEQCAGAGYRSATLSVYRSSCRHILIWLHRSRISITDVNAQILERFLHHDCVCPVTSRNPPPSMPPQLPLRSSISILPAISCPDRCAVSRVYDM